MLAAALKHSGRSVAVLDLSNAMDGILNSIEGRAAIDRFVGNLKSLPFYVDALVLLTTQHYHLDIEEDGSEWRYFCIPARLFIHLLETGHFKDFETSSRTLRDILQARVDSDPPFLVRPNWPCRMTRDLRHLATNRV